MIRKVKRKKMEIKRKTEVITVLIQTKVTEMKVKKIWTLTKRILNGFDHPSMK